SGVKERERRAEGRPRVVPKRPTGDLRPRHRSAEPSGAVGAVRAGEPQTMAVDLGGAGGGIFKSSDGGETWTELTRNPGLPAGLLGNIGLAVSPAKPARLWALIEADSGGVYRSADGGATWRYVNGERRLRQRPWYYSRVFADPRDSNTVYALNVLAYKSTDGGATFRHLPDPHGDNHDMCIAANDPQRMIEGNDGGANVSTN